MGGKGSGGGRPGAGRKPKDATVGALHGSRRTRARNQTRNQNAPNQTVPNQNAGAPDGAPSLPAPHIPPPPGNLTLDELAVWNELAPLALKEGTLTEATYLALRDLCEAIVLKRKLLRTIDDDGLTVTTLQGNKAAHPLLSQFRGLMQRVEAGMLRFKLSPMGKEIPTVGGEQPADPFSEFDEPGALTNRPGEITH